MLKYKDIHDSLTKKILNNILNERKIKISIINWNNIILISLTLFTVFFLFFIIYTLYNSNLFLLIEWNENTINILKNILSFLFIIFLYSTLGFWYIYYFYNLFILIKTKKKMILRNLMYSWIIIFIILLVLFVIILFLFIKFDNNLEFFTYLSSHYSKMTVYWYFSLLLISMLLFLIEYLYKSKNNYSELYTAIVLTIFPPRFWYKLLTAKSKKIIKNAFSIINSSELKDINSYLIYWNTIENWIKITLLICGWFYIIIQMIIWKFSLNMEKIFDLIKQDIPFSVTILFLLIVLLFIFRIFFTPSLIRSSYYVYLKESKELI